MNLLDLWLPIVIATVAVFVVSSVVHMLLPIHKSDMRGLPNEEQVLDALREGGVSPGHYMFPWASSMQELGSPAIVERYRRGPVGVAIIRASGPPSMGASLLQWAILALVISVVVAYLASMALGPGTAATEVFRFTATAAWLGHAGAVTHDAIWKGGRWAVSWKFVFDGLLYGLSTGAAFAWLWPTA